MNYTVREKTTVREALIALNQLSHYGLTLFVLDNNNRVVGVLTDGDIRRALIAGISVDAPVKEAMNVNFVSFNANDNDIVHTFRDVKAKGVRVIPVLDDKGCLVDVIDSYVRRSVLPIDAVLMAGGKGERLRPLTEKTPKPLLKVGDKAIIDHNIDRLIDYGVNHISVTVNYLGEQLEAHFANPRGEVQVNTVREPKYLGTIGSIKFVEEFYNDTVLVMNSDLFTNINYEDFYLHFKEHDAEMSVAAVPYTVSVPYGIFDLEGRNIQGLIEKPTYNYYANAGIYLIKRSALDEIPNDTFFNATDLIEKLIGEGKKVIRFPLNGTWIDIGNPQDFAKANDLVKHIMK